MARIILAGGITFYVSPSGLDTNSGLTVALPWLTIQHALNTILTNYDLAGNTAIIQCADSGGTPYAACSLMAPFTGGGVVVLQGDVAFPQYCRITTASPGAITVSNGAQLFVNGFDLVNTVGNGLFAQLGGYINIIGPMAFDAVASDQMHAETQGVIEISTGTPGYLITGGGKAHFGAALNGTILFSEEPCPVTISNTPAFSVGFCHIQDNGVLYANANTGLGPTFGGSGCTAGTKRYYVTCNGVIDTELLHSDPYFPGGAAGFTSSGGQYFA